MLLMVDNVIQNFCPSIGDTRSLSNDEAQELKKWLKMKLAPKVKNVKVWYLLNLILKASKPYYVVTLYIISDND